jgi:arylsulfatase B
MLWGMWLAGCGEQAVCEEESGGNVLVVVLDDMGVDTVGSYGLHPEPPQTPSLDALAARGLRFDRAYSAPLCAPARAILLTGRYGRRHGLGTNIPFDWFDGELPLSEQTVAEAARDGEWGYATAAFGKWHLMTRSTRQSLDHPNAQGFDHFDGTIANPTDVWDDSDGRHHDHFHWERLINGQIEHVDGYLATATVDATLQALPTLSEPWLAYVGLHLPHGPMHVAPASLQGTGVTEESAEVDKFAAMVEAADTELGRLLEELPEDTTVIVVGDNGSDLPLVRPPWTLPGGKSTLFEGGIRVPLLVAGPWVEPGRTDALVHTVDVAATVAALTCGELQRPDGLSLLPLLRDPAAPSPRQYVYSELFGPPGPPDYDTDLRTVLDGHYKLIRNVNSGEETLHALGLSPAEESPDLLASGEVPEGVYEELSAQMDTLDRRVRYDRGCAHTGAPGALAVLIVLLIPMNRDRRRSGPPRARAEAGPPGRRRPSR